ncbi:MAG: hypothetical protein IJI46_09975 [Erysipelotrichaceae bacterium]|nr:hypothetical protein [Erysipelotrichaceae bacterium]
MNRKNLGVEIIVILAVFIMSISILSKAFVMAKSRSSEAARLSDAVTLASNAADVFLACDDEKEMLKVLNENGNAELKDGLNVYYDNDLRPAVSGAFKVVIDQKDEGDFTKAYISIFYGEEEIYAIETGKEAKK